MPPSTTLLIYLLAALSAIAPFAIDTYLPAMPQMADFFSVPIHRIEASISLFMLGFALGRITSYNVCYTKLLRPNGQLVLVS